MASAAASLELARGDTRDPDLRTLRAPDRTVTVPDGNRRAGEALSRRDYAKSKPEQHQRFGGRPPALMQAAMFWKGVKFFVRL